MTGPQNYQAAILASAAATTLGELETWAWREIAGSKLSGS